MAAALGSGGLPPLRRQPPWWRVRGPELVGAGEPGRTLAAAGTLDRRRGQRRDADVLMEPGNDLPRVRSGDHHGQGDDLRGEPAARPHLRVVDGHVGAVLEGGVQGLHHLAAAGVVLLPLLGLVRVLLGVLLTRQGADLHGLLFAHLRGGLHQQGEHDAALGLVRGLRVLLPARAGRGRGRSHGRARVPGHTLSVGALLEVEFVLAALFDALLVGLVVDPLGVALLAEHVVLRGVHQRGGHGRAVPASLHLDRATVGGGLAHAVLLGPVVEHEPVAAGPQGAGQFGGLGAGQVRAVGDDVPHGHAVALEVLDHAQGVLRQARGRGVQGDGQHDAGHVLAARDGRVGLPTPADVVLGALVLRARGGQFAGARMVAFALVPARERLRRPVSRDSTGLAPAPRQAVNELPAGPRWRAPATLHEHPRARECIVYHDPMTTNSPFRLERPPVKRVALNIEFEAEPRLQGWHLADFFSSLSRRYPSREEMAPDLGDDDESIEFMSASNGWPIPRTQFSGFGRALAIQGNELEVVWNFEAEGDSKYPGFDSLMSEAWDVFQKLVESTASFDVSINPIRVQCFYRNEIVEMGASALALGVLSGWSASHAIEAPKEGYIGVRLHGCGYNDRHECSSYVMVDSMGDDNPTLSFQVGRLVRDGEGADFALREAHDELISLFQMHTPVRLREGWGEK